LQFIVCMIISCLLRSLHSFFVPFNSKLCFAVAL